MVEEAMKKAVSIIFTIAVIVGILGVVVAGLIIWGAIEVIPEIVAYFQK